MATIYKTGLPNLPLVTGELIQPVVALLAPLQMLALTGVI
jgi:hypothetical protein